MHPLRHTMRMKRFLGFAVFMIGLAIAILALWPGLMKPARSWQESIDRGSRSILLITLDTTRADHLGAYGAKLVATPNLDRLAGQGVTFENAFSVAPITLPAHTSILSGLYPYQTGVRNNGLHRALPRLTMLAERLLDAGYRTAAFVSASVLERRYGLDQGFEIYDDDLSTGRERHSRVVPDRPAEATVASAHAWLDELGTDERFFAWVHFYDPHAVYSPPAPYRDRFRERPYDGEIAYMDDQLGRLLAHPRVRSDPDLAVIVVGDHGESLGEHEERTHGILAYDATLHVPLLMRLSGADPGTRIAEPVSQVDLVPTLLDLLGKKPEPDLPGRSLLHTLESSGKGSHRGLYAESYLPFYSYGWAKLQILRLGRWKYIAAPEPELYDLQRDPRELSNVVEQRPGLAHDLRRDLDELLTDSEEAEGEASLELDLDAIEKLRSLGYIAIGPVLPAGDQPRPDPKTVIGLHTALERVRMLLDDRLFEEAETALRQVLVDDPDNLALLRELSSALEGQGRLDEAVGAVQRAMSLDPDAANLYLRLSRLESRRGQKELALKLIESALEQDPLYLDARLQKAQLLHSMGRTERAKSILQTTLEQEPDNPRVNLVYAQIVDVTQGDWEAAEERLRQALARDPFLAAAWLRLGQVQQQQGRLDEAVTSFREGLERSPDSVELHATLGTLLASMGVGAEAEQNLREAIRLSQVIRPELHVSLGAWLAEHGRPEEALQEYDVVLQQWPGDASARNNRAIALLQLGRVEEAEQGLVELIAEYPRHADAFNNLAAVAMGREEWDAMELNARRALELNPAMVEAWSNLGIALGRLEKYSESQEAFHKAIELQPTYWQAQFNLAATLARAGSSREAADLYLAVLEQDPGVPEVYLELGELFSGPLDDRSRAKGFFNAFLRHISDEDPRAAEVRQRLTRLQTERTAGEG